MPLSEVLTASYFQLNLRADDPLIYDNNALAELEAILRRSSSASSGFSINFPINFQLGVSESRPTIDNFGSSVIYPTITLTGPLTTPEIVNITTNMAFTIDEVLGAGTYTASGIRGAMNQEGSVDTYSGNPIQATRDAESPISKFSLYGDATQTTYSGKNLCFYGYYESTATARFNVNKNILQQTFTISYISDVTAGNASIYLFTDGTNRGYLGASIQQTAGVRRSVTVTLDATNWGYVQNATTSVHLTAYLGNAGHTTNASVTQAMVENGSSMTAYEPYVGGVPSPNPDYPQAVNVVTGEQTVKVTGKNLFDKTTATQGKFINASGIITNDATALVSDYIHIKPNADYYVSGRTLWNSIALYDGSKTFIERRNLSYVNGVINITNTSCAYIRINASIGDLNNIQLELGSQATTYEAYREQDYEVNLGKNLLHITETSGSASDVTVTMNDDGTITLNGTATATAYKNIARDFEFGSFIVYSVGQEQKSQTTDGYTLSASITNGTLPNIGHNTNNGWWAIRVDNGSTFNNAVLKVQLEKGTQATTYAPYFTPIELCKIGTYQDYIYNDNGTWKVHKEVGKDVYDGTENWATQNDVFVRGLDEIAQGDYNAEILMISDHFTGRKTWYRGELADGQCAKIVGANQQIAFRYNALNNVVADWQTWLSTHNTTFYYALATPTTTEITEQALIDQLDAILEAHLYEGINNISNVTISPNLSGDLEIKTGQTLTVINSLSLVGSSGAAEIGLGGSELAMVGSVADELTINGTTGAVTKTTRIGKIESYAGETITTDYISTSGGLDSDATIYYVLPSSSTSVINTLDSTALTAFNNVVASGGVSAQTNIGSISVDVTTVTAQDVAVVDIKQHTVTINGVGAYSKFSGDWLTLDVGLNELQLITENNTDTGSAVIKYRVGYMGV